METAKLKAYALQPDTNSSYLSNYKFHGPAPQMDSSAIGLMMILSTLQYQAPYVAPGYSNAAAQAGKAAYIQSGGQAIQDKVASKVESKVKETCHDIGITDGAIGAVLGTAKVVRDRQVDFNGPRLFMVHTHVTLGPDHGLLGLGMNF